jgi:two-component system, cell cycle sensor histidine kinase and response regulator CckA
MSQAGPGQSARILIVDDELGIRNFFDRVLRNAGYTTVLAPDGPDALKICEASNSFDLLVVDLAMPIMRGDELARQLRQATPALKVLYITGDSERLFQDKGTLWEGEAFVDKPCSAAALVEAVSLLLVGRLPTKS